MIKLTKPNGLALFLAPEQITAVTFVSQVETAIWSSDRESRVTESPEEVVRKIMEYKLAMAEYRALSEKLESSDCDKRLRRLTGLEDTPDAK